MAARGSRWRSRSTTTSRSATSAGSSPRSSSRPTSRWSRRSSGTRASGCRSTTRGRCSTGWSPSARTSIDRLRALVERDQVEILGGGLLRAGPRLAARSATGSASSSRMARRARAPVRAAAARRLARRARLGAGPADLARRRPATSGRSSTTPTSARRRSPRRTSGARTRPRTRATSCASSGPSRGCATGSRSATSTRSSPTCATHATEAGDRVGMMGDDGEKFGAWPTTWEHCWGERPLGRAVLRGARGQRRLADDRRRRRDWLDGASRRSAASTSRPAPTPRWASGRCRPTRACAFTDVLHARAGERRPEARWLRGAFWRNFQVKYREINDLHKQMLRTSDAVAAMPGGPGARARPRPPLPAASRTTATGTGCSAGSTSATCGSRRYEHLIAAEDLAETATRHAATRAELARPRHGRRSTRSAWPTAGQVVDGRPRRGRRHRRLGHPRRSGTRWPRSCAAGPRRTTRRCARTRPSRGVPGAGRRRGRRRRPDADRLDPRHRPGQGAGAGRPPRSTTLRAPLRARPVPRRSRRRPRPGRGRGERARRRASTAPFAIDRARRRAGSSPTRATAVAATAAVEVTKTITLGGDRLRPDAELEVDLRAPRRRARRGAARHRVGADDARRRRQPGGVVGGRRRADGATTRAGTASGLATHRARATTTSAWRSTTDRRAGRRRLVGPDRDGVELRGRLRARLPGQRAAAVLAGLGLGARRSAGTRSDRATLVDDGRDDRTGPRRA